MGATREEVIAVANRYLQSGLVDHDGTKVALAPECQRHENGYNSGANGPAIAEGLKGEAMKTITGIRNMQWVVEGEDAVAVYELDTQFGIVYLTEYFRVSGGKIRDIRATFTTSQNRENG